MLRFRALALTRLDGDVWQWELCAVYYAHSDDFGGNWCPPTRAASAPCEKCALGELVELFGAGSVTWMFAEERIP